MKLKYYGFDMQPDASSCMAFYSKQLPDVILMDINSAR
jgi:hypothetical protein